MEAQHGTLAKLGGPGHGIHAHQGDQSGGPNNADTKKP